MSRRNEPIEEHDETVDVQNRPRTPAVSETTAMSNSGGDAAKPDRRGADDEESHDSKEEESDTDGKPREGATLKPVPETTDPSSLPQQQVSPDAKEKSSSWGHRLIYAEAPTEEYEMTPIINVECIFKLSTSVGGAVLVVVMVLLGTVTQFWALGNLERGSWGLVAAFTGGVFINFAALFLVFSSYSRRQTIGVVKTFDFFYLSLQVVGFNLIDAWERTINMHWGYTMILVPNSFITCFVLFGMDASHMPRVMKGVLMIIGFLVYLGLALSILLVNETSAYSVDLVVVDTQLGTIAQTCALNLAFFCLKFAVDSLVFKENIILTLFNAKCKSDPGETWLRLSGKTADELNGVERQSTTITKDDEEQEEQLCIVPVLSRSTSTMTRSELLAALEAKEDEVQKLKKQLKMSSESSSNDIDGDSPVANNDDDDEKRESLYAPQRKSSVFKERACPSEGETPSVFETSSNGPSQGTKTDVEATSNQQKDSENPTSASEVKNGERGEEADETTAPEEIDEDYTLPEGEWTFQPDTDGLYYNEESGYYYHPPSALFYDGESEMWYDPTEDVWYDPESFEEDPRKE